jgi:hypothetical protein
MRGIGLFITRRRYYRAHERATAPTLPVAQTSALAGPLAVRLEIGQFRGARLAHY